MMETVHLLLCVLLVGRYVCGLDNGVALTPPMGWLQWERFACNVNCDSDPNNCISEKLFRDMADHLAADGFKDAGYQYVNIDDCWTSKERDASGKLQADPKRFPHGIKSLADYVHSKGLKLGIYGDLGNKTCGGYPGTLGHIQEDASTFASWGVDMLKLDGCYASAAIYETGYPDMTIALNKTGRPIVFSCSWPAYIKNPNYTVIAKNCNLWRNYRDISDSWDSVLGIINYYGDNQDLFQPFAGPGNWNDPDMLIIGNFGLSLDQQRVQMAVWAIFAAPLLMSNDLRELPGESKAILLNKEVISVNQDPMGTQGRLVKSSHTHYRGRVGAGNHLVYSRPLQGGDVAVALLNTYSFSSPRNITFTFKEVGLTSPRASIRDLFALKDMGTYTGSFSAPVDPSGVRFFRLTAMSARQ